MSQFVQACRAEWDRLGVPQAAANEMAADLEADLAEAQADGASPEEVLGNGYFDAKSFAASWAIAQGVADEGPRSATVQLRTRTVSFFSTAVISLALGALGLLLLVGRHFGSASAASIRRPLPRQMPSILIGPHYGGSGIALNIVGLVLLVIGIVGLGVTLWLWRPWSMQFYRSDRDPDVGLPTFL